MVFHTVFLLRRAIQNLQTDSAHTCILDKASKSYVVQTLDTGDDLHRTGKRESSVVLVTLTDFSRPGEGKSRSSRLAASTRVTVFHDQVK